MEEPYDEESRPPNDELLPCRVCGRRFLSGVLRKHTPICQKAASKRRKTFDSSRQRAEGTDFPVLKPMKPKSNHTSNIKSDKSEPPKKQSNWRQTHEEFIAAIRAAKGINKILKEGGPLPPPPPPSINPDYIQCPYCQRRFNENAADRHIKFCKDQAARNPSKARGFVPADARAKPQQCKIPLKKTTYSGAPGPSGSRLPQPSSGSPVGGSPASKGSLTDMSTSSGYPMSRSSGSPTSPPSGVLKGKPPVTLRNTAVTAGPNRRIVSNADSARVEADSSSGQQTKFCHECGTKFPVDKAKFCCVCGVRRICV